MSGVSEANTVSWRYVFLILAPGTLLGVVAVQRFLGASSGLRAESPVQQLLPAVGLGVVVDNAEFGAGYDRLLEEVLDDPTGSIGRLRSHYLSTPGHPELHSPMNWRYLIGHCRSGCGALSRRRLSRDFGWISTSARCVHRFRPLLRSDRLRPIGNASPIFT